MIAVFRNTPGAVASINREGWRYSFLSIDLLLLFAKTEKMNVEYFFHRIENCEKEHCIEDEIY